MNFANPSASSHKPIVIRLKFGDGSGWFNEALRYAKLAHYSVKFVDVSQGLGVHGKGLMWRV